METLTIALLVAVPLLTLIAGAVAGWLIAGKRFYNDGYDDGFGDGKAETISMSGACGDCGWEADYAEMPEMIQEILSHASDCPARRY